MGGVTCVADDVSIPNVQAQEGFRVQPAQQGEAAMQSCPAPFSSACPYLLVVRTLHPCM